MQLFTNQQGYMFSFGIFRSLECYIFTGVSVQPIGPILKCCPETSVRNYILRCLRPQESADLFTQHWKPQITHTNQPVIVFKHKNSLILGYFANQGTGEPRSLSVLPNIIFHSLSTKIIKNAFMNTSDLKNTFFFNSLSFLTVFSSPFMRWLLNLEGLSAW